MREVPGFLSEIQDKIACAFWFRLFLSSDHLEPTYNLFPPLIREFLLVMQKPHQILPSAPHFIPRTSSTEHGIYMSLLALHQSESDSLLSINLRSLFSFLHCSMNSCARWRTLPRGDMPSAAKLRCASWRASIHI